MSIPQSDTSSSDSMSAQQRHFGGDRSRLELYRDLVYGDTGSLPGFLGFELYSLFLTGLGGALGFAGRGLALPRFLRSSGGALNIGRGVTIRQPGRVSLGRKVILDDYSVIDYRSTGKESVGGITLDDHVLVGRNSLIVAKGGTIHLKRAVNISSCCRIATQSSVEIDESVLIAAYVYIGPGNHQIDDLSRPIIEQEMDVRGGVKIGANSWIGAHSTILDGVRIGRDVIIGAHSLVRDDIPDRAIAVGTPARVIRYRGETSNV
ncbi:MAG: acyltransferase [Deltaproteobacteria bacterium]|nr:acyltransferase [Deltaproteobacteria bacterium]